VRDDENTIKTAKTGKVTAVVVVMSIFTKKRCNLQHAESGDKKFLARRWKVLISQRKIPAD
jgi:hypothetical protein